MTNSDTMFLTPYFSTEDNQFQFTVNKQATKKVAGDFNPIHDEDNKRFCVPGDLLFGGSSAKRRHQPKNAFWFFRYGW